MSSHRNGPFEGKRGLCVEVRGDNIEQAIRLLTRKVKKEGLLREIRDRKAYEKPSEARRRAEEEAVKRWHKRRSKLDSR